MIQILVVEDNIYKLKKLFDKQYLSWDGKSIMLTATQTECERVLRMQQGEPVQSLYLDYELGPGCGDGLSILQNIEPYMVKKVYGTTFNREIMKEFAKCCRDKGIEFEAMNL